MRERRHTSDDLTIVLQKTRRRVLWLRAMDALSLGAAIAMGLLALLIVFRFQVLSAPVLGALACVALAVAAAKVARAIPTSAEISRLLDARCGLADALSTALHFQDSPGEIPQLQRAQAGKLASTLDVAAAVPFQMPRSAAVLAGVAGLVLLVGAFRYGVERRLTLTPPIAAAPGDSLTLALEADTQARERRQPKQSPLLVAVPGTEMTSVGANANASGVPLGQHPAESTVASNRDPSAQQPPTGEQPGATSKSEEGASSSPRAGSENGPGSQEGSPQSAQSGAKQSSSPNSSGLMSKLRDAVSSLVSSLDSKKRPNSDQPPSNGQSSQQANGKQPAGQPSGGKNTAGGENSESKEGGDQTAGEDSDKQAGGKGQGKGGDQSASAKPGSGMGRQDGSKELKDAEQQAAMGKLSEIIGKRSAGVSGEMSIEPQSGPQQLRTRYSKSSAKHAAGGGDVNREGVPVALQSYVQEYFLQVRKQAAVKTARAGKPETHE